MKSCIKDVGVMLLVEDARPYVRSFFELFGLRTHFELRPGGFQVIQTDDNVVCVGSPDGDFQVAPYPSVEDALDKLIPHMLKWLEPPQCSADDFVEQCHSLDIKVRVAQRNGKHRIMTRDFRPTRINLTVVDDTIVGWTTG